MRTKPNEQGIVLSTVLLNWNRADLLARTLESYLATISVPYELIIIDNGSTDESPHHIQAALEGRANHQAVLLPDNLGGEAINIGIERCRGRYIHVSENDMEYLPGWDGSLLSKLRAFPGLGQISPFAPFYRGEDGEPVRWEGVSPRTKDGMTVYVKNNIGTTCVAPREVYDSGLRWGARSGKFRFPKDGRFSKAVNALGYFVAMNDTPVVRNLGHDIEEFKKRLPYYIENYAAKPRMGLEGFDRRLRAGGHRLARDEDGRWSIEELGDNPETLEGKG